MSPGLARLASLGAAATRHGKLGGAALIASLVAFAVWLGAAPDSQRRDPSQPAFSALGPSAALGSSAALPPQPARPQPGPSPAAAPNAAVASGHVRYELSGGQVGRVELWFSGSGERSVLRVRAGFPHRSWAGTPPVHLWVRREGSLHTAVDEATGRGERGPAELMAHGLSSQLQRGWLTPLDESAARARGFTLEAGHTRILGLACRCLTRLERDARACFHRGVLLELGGKLRGLPMKMQAVDVELDVDPSDSAFELPESVPVEELTLERLLASKGASAATLAQIPQLPSR